MSNQIKVSVATVPNGYILDLASGDDAQGYMYFNLPELLEGFIYHVGFNELSPLGKTDINTFLKMVSKWEDKGMLVKELQRKEEDISLLRENETLLKEKLTQNQRLIEKQKQKIDKLQERLADIS